MAVRTRVGDSCGAVEVFLEGGVANDEHVFLVVEMADEVVEDRGLLPAASAALVLVLLGGVANIGVPAMRALDGYGALEVPLCWQLSELAAQTYHQFEEGIR
ncbi:hypothetical protein FZEAL_5639 [Fusarium zealandicum]|uniref:Uncharacterized protein n=1 Tax=Fusarium zealandicum TaxID=1053134 RepID=A0A8H4UJC2_9HYPO|nr:hypothetical protein FZEAL_5639 [Fusarium zealandicum]